MTPFDLLKNFNINSLREKADEIRSKMETCEMTGEAGSIPHSSNAPFSSRLYAITMKLTPPGSEDSNGTFQNYACNRFWM